MRHPLHPPGVVIGRGSEAELRINDPGISRSHAQLSVTIGDRGTEVTVHDLGSTNGVILNGQRVSDGHVRDGSHIQLANTEIVVRITEIGRQQRSRRRHRRHWGHLPRPAGRDNHRRGRVRRRCLN